MKHNSKTIHSVSSVGRYVLLLSRCVARIGGIVKYGRREMYFRFSTDTRKESNISSFGVRVLFNTFRSRHTRLFNKCETVDSGSSIGVDRTYKNYVIDGRHLHSPVTFWRVSHAQFAQGICTSAVRSSYFY